MSKPWILLTPSTRGISHSLLHLLLRSTPSTIPILATARSSLPSIYPKSDRLHVVNLDVRDESSIRSATEKASKLFPRETHHLHLALTLPGVLLIPPEKSISQVEENIVLETLRVNTLGPVLLMKHFSPFLPKKAVKMEGDIEGLPGHATWLSVSARVGSTTDNRLGGWYSYRLSKSALNSAVKNFDLELAQKSDGKAIVVGYHPGTVKTDLSRDFWKGMPDDKLFSPDDAAQKLWNVIINLDTKQRGKVWDWKGEEVPP
ncbi:hypothetical protein QBC36DRAFT_300611 [Triangularia setosa]|uniref:Short-chain dehydrogenase/reductase n=1 Tax=Triangularia setosa TaxID=2587417 RepID=A0AAN6W7V9_9PEZI|nr:hypothetical protein QBC36DRAFT_300611 [Podospora setosa]